MAMKYWKSVKFNGHQIPKQSKSVHSAQYHYIPDILHLFFHQFISLLEDERISPFKFPSFTHD